MHHVAVSCFFVDAVPGVAPVVPSASWPVFAKNILPSFFCAFFSLAAGSGYCRVLSASFVGANCLSLRSTQLCGPIVTFPLNVDLLGQRRQPVFKIFFCFFAVTIFSFFPHGSRRCHGSARVLLHGIAPATFDARCVRLQMTGQTGSQRFMAPEVFDGMPYNEKVRNAYATCHCFVFART